MNRLRISTAAALLGFLTMATGVQAGDLPSTAGFAESGSRFLVGASEATGNATVFTGESVTSGHLPTRLNLPDGSKYQIGVGSRVQVGRNRLILDGGSLEILNTGSAPPVLEVAGLEFSVQNPRTRAALYISRPDIVSASVNEGALRASRPNGEKLQDVNAGEMVTLANTRSDIKIDKRNAAADIAEVQAEQLRHMGKLGEINPTLGSKAGALLATLAGASGGLIGASLGDSSGFDGAASPSLGAAASSMTLAASSAASPAFDAAAMQKATQNVQTGMSDGLWGVTGCGAGCRWGVPIVTTHIFFAPTVGGFVRPFCILRSCLEPAPFRP